MAVIECLFYCYLNRVKSLSKSGNPRKDQATGSLVPSGKESASASSFPFSVESEDPLEQNQEVKVAELPRKNMESFSHNSTSEVDRNSSCMMPIYTHNGREESGVTLGSFEMERVDMKSSQSSYVNKIYSSVQNSFDGQDEEKVPKVSPPRRKISRKIFSTRQECKI